MAKVRRCRKVIPKGTRNANFCGIPLNKDGECPEHGKDVK